MSDKEEPTEGIQVHPKTGLDALEDLYAPFTANITINVGKYTFRAHREYLARSPFFQKFDLDQDPLSIDIPVPSKFMDCLTFIYIGGKALLEFHQGIFVPSVFLDTFRNALFLELDEIVEECYKRFHKIWRDVYFQETFNVQYISIEDIEGLLECSIPPFTDAEKALMVTQWSSRREPEITRLVQRYTRPLRSLTPFVQLVREFPASKRPLFIPMVSPETILSPKTRRFENSHYSSRHSQKIGPLEEDVSDESERSNAETRFRNSHPLRPDTGQRETYEKPTSYSKKGMYVGKSTYYTKRGSSSSQSSMSRGRSRSVRERSPYYKRDQSPWSSTYDRSPDTSPPVSPHFSPFSPPHYTPASPHYSPTSPSYSPVSSGYDTPYLSTGVKREGEEAGLSQTGSKKRKSHDGHFNGEHSKSGATPPGPSSSSTTAASTSNGTTGGPSLNGPSSSATSTLGSGSSGGNVGGLGLGGDS